MTSSDTLQTEPNESTLGSNSGLSQTLTEEPLYSTTHGDAYHGDNLELLKICVSR